MPGAAPVTRGAPRTCVLSTYVTRANYTNFCGMRSIGFSRSKRTRLHDDSTPRVRTTVASLRRRKFDWCKGEILKKEDEF